MAGTSHGLTTDEYYPTDILLWDKSHFLKVLFTINYSNTVVKFDIDQECLREKDVEKQRREVQPTQQIRQIK